MLKAHQYLTTCAVSFAQAGAVAALEGPQDCVDEMVAEFKRRRDMLVPALNKIPGVSCLMPEGSFYVFADISSSGKSSEELTWYLLREAGIAVVPGPTFGPAGEGYIRISFANSYEKIEEATVRMADALSRLE